jgi:hypothetical protein
MEPFWLRNCGWRGDLTNRLADFSKHDPEGANGAAAIWFPNIFRNFGKPGATAASGGRTIHQP